MKFENTDFWGFQHSFRGMRNPLNSWDKSDSFDCLSSDSCEGCKYEGSEVYDCLKTLGTFMIGDKDLELAQRLIRGGPEHRKFLRQIMVSVDITAPLYWWKEFDTYKVGTTANSTSTMHKLATTPITMECFETDDFVHDLTFWTSNDANYEIKDLAEDMIFYLEKLRQKYNETGDKRYWKELVRWLPNGWLQTRTVTLNYENLRSMYFQRRNHKLTEWSVGFMQWIRSLPYAKELIMYEGE